MDNKDLFMKIHLSEKEGKFMIKSNKWGCNMTLYFPFDSYVNNYLKIYSLMLNGKKKIFLRK